MINTIKILKKIEESIARIVTGTVIIILLSMLLLAFLQVILRNIFATGLPWVDIVLRNLVLWVGMLGGVLAARSGRQINIEIITKFTPRVPANYLRGIASLFTVVVCYFLVKASWTFVSVEKEFSSVLYGNVPNWYAQVILPVGFALIGIQVLFNLLLNRDSEFSYSPAELENSEQVVDDAVSKGIISSTNSSLSEEDE